MRYFKEMPLFMHQIQMFMSKTAVPSHTGHNGLVKIEGTPIPVTLLGGPHLGRAIWQ